MNYLDKSIGTAQIPSCLLVPKLITALSSSKFSAEWSAALDLYQKSNFSQSLKLFRRINKLHSGSIECLNNIACCCLYIGNKPRALQALHQAVTQEQDEIPVYNLALAFVLNWDFQSALKTLNLCWKSTSEDFASLKKYLESRCHSPYPTYRSGLRQPKAAGLGRGRGGLRESSCELKAKTKKTFYRVVENIDWKKLSLFNKPLPKVQVPRAKSLNRLRPVPGMPSSACNEANELGPGYAGYAGYAESVEYGKSVPKKQKQFTKKPAAAYSQSTFIQENVETSSLFSQNFYNSGHRALPGLDLDGQLDGRFLSNIPKLTPKNLFSRHISETDCKLVLLELHKPAGLRDYDLLDRLTKKNKFFSRFNEKTRAGLLRVSSVLEFSPGQIILNAGQQVPHMFAILKGSVVLEKLSNKLGSQPVETATLYDGRYFGESSLVPEEERSAIKAFKNTTCRAVENSIVLTLPKDLYNSILLEQIEVDIEKKFKVLAQVDFFAGVNKFLLVPLASALKVKSFVNGDSILKAGDRPEGLFIILKGFVSLVAEGFRVVHIDNRSQSPTRALQGGAAGHAGHTGHAGHAAYAGSGGKSALGKDEASRIREKQNEINQVLFSLTSSTWNEIFEKVNLEEQGLKDFNKRLVVESLEYKILKQFDYFACRALAVPAVAPGLEVQPSKFSVVFPR